MVRRIGMILLCVLFAGFVSNTLRADDTEIFGGAVVNLEPNVLIIFDNSGSMDEEIQQTPYDPTRTYSGPYSTSMVYSSTNQRTWSNFQNIGNDLLVSSTEIACTQARDDLNEQGWAYLRISTTAPHNCANWPTSNRWLRTGNYRNYLLTPGAEYRRKIDIAKDVVNEIIDTVDGVRFGIMIFNRYNSVMGYDQGGRVVAPCATRTTSAQKQALKNIIDGLDPETNTPLSETLAEAGLYFAGMQSWANPTSTSSGIITNGRYISPIQWRCQKNYIILMTDGEPTQDQGAILRSNYTYMNGLAIGDYDQDIGRVADCRHTDEYSWIEKRADGTCVQHEYDLNGSDYLDDVAKFLHDQDILHNPGRSDSAGVSFDNADYPAQNIITYTIGFNVNNKLLSDTAINGGGRYYTTAENINLTDAFHQIIGSILEANVEFVAPVVPVNRANRTYADNGLYLGIFSPDFEGLWAGNLKKFGLSESGQILDRHGNPATNSSGLFLANAHSCWGQEVSGEEGMDVEKGGAGAVLLNDDTRTFYTRKTGTGLIHFNKANVTPTELGFADNTYTAQRDDLVDFVRAEGVYRHNSGDAKARSWVMGDILHSRPAVMYDKANSTNVIFVGANDGFLHCFLDDDNTQINEYNSNLNDDTVEEAWCFLPWDLAGRLRSLPPGDNVHDYFVDGTPVVFSLRGTPKTSYVTFGLRRGGNKYYCLNVTNYTSPSFAWEIPNSSITSIGTEPFGQSWSTPRYCTIKANAGDTVGKQVLLCAGGYDTNQDSGASPAAADSRGRAVYAIEPGATGCTLSSQIRFHHGTAGNIDYGYMDHCIVDLNSFDYNSDGFEDTIYAGSLGGDLFVFHDRDGNGTWERRRIFSAGTTGGLKKFFNSPGVVQMTLSYEYLYIGSGDREDPLNTSTTNYFYAIKNKWPTSWNDGSPITVSDLVNLDTDVFNGGSLADQTTKQTALEAGKGWYFRLPNTGEKVVSSPVVFSNAVWFTTFTPAASTATGEDQCSSGTGAGTARIYAVNYLTGTAMYDLNNDGQKERSVEIGSGIPSDPVVIVTKTNSFMGVGIQEGVRMNATPGVKPFVPYNWIQK